MARRRRKGSGSIAYQKDRDQYVARIWGERPDGTWARLGKGFEKKKDAEAWLRGMEALVAKGPIPEPLKLHKLLDDWLKGWKAEKGSPNKSTERSYTGTVAELKRVCPNKPIDDYRASQLNVCLKKIPGDRSRQLARSVLNMAWKMAR